MANGYGTALTLKNLLIFHRLYRWAFWACKLPMAILHMANHKSRLYLAIGMLLALSASGCATVAMTLLGVGASTATGAAVSYASDGIAYRTFTAPLPEVENATRTGLNRMGIRLDATAKTEQGKTLHAFAPNRAIEIELDSVSAKATRVRTVAKQGLFFNDRATAMEILLQMEKILGTI